MIPNRIIFMNFFGGHSILKKNNTGFPITSSHFGDIQPGDYYSEDTKQTEEYLLDHPQFWKPLHLPDTFEAIPKEIVTDLIAFIEAKMEYEQYRSTWAETNMKAIVHKPDCDGKRFLLALRGY